MDTVETKEARLFRLRKKIFSLEDEFPDELCTADEPQGKLEGSFCSFLWQIEEAIRAEVKKGK